MSTIVGTLYTRDDTRRDAGFSIFYMGINLGAFTAPMITGYLAQRVDWHLGFAAAGVGMALGLVQYVIGRKRLQPAIDRLAARGRQRGQCRLLADHLSRPHGPNRLASPRPGVEADRRDRDLLPGCDPVLGGRGPAGRAGRSTCSPIATRGWTVGGFSFPSSWFQSVQPIFVIVLAPVFAWIWMRFGPREPSVPG